MGRKIGIVSSKGGVGKTIVTINLASAIMEWSKKVVALDADVKLSGLSLQLGMYYFPVTLNDVLKDGRSILESLYIHSTGLRIIPASLGIKGNVNISKLQSVLNSSALEDSLVLIDCPPGLEKNALSVMKSCSELIIVTTPELPAVTDVLKTITIAKKNNCKILGIVVNKYRNIKEEISLNEIGSTCELPILGAIPEDARMVKSIFRRTPLVVSHPNSKSAIEFKKIAANIIGERFTPPKGIRRFVWK